MYRLPNKFTLVRKETFNPAKRYVPNARSFFNHIIPDFYIAFCFKKTGVYLCYLEQAGALVQMHARGGTTKKAASKFEDSKRSHMSRPRY